jgi:hypothetical protein
MTDFEQNSYVFIKGFIDSQSIQTISRYMEYSLKQNEMPRCEVETSISYVRYADPLTETILQNSLEHVEELTGKKIHPTYSFSRVYVKGDVLKPHVDRPACEISVTVNVATSGELWPIWMKVLGKEPVNFLLEPGDAVVYKGCEVTHWRDVADKTEVNAQFMLHYVDQNGPHASYKFDNRAGLGVASSARSM